MVKEVAEVAMGMSGLRLVRADQMKFIAMVVPGQAGALEMRLDCKREEDGGMKVVASLLEDGKVSFKFSGVLEIE
jgi:3-hydroxymyristoyl/3-hydroxydecanoyl-(acyl carrier protein) dehydratase